MRKLNHISKNSFLTYIPKSFAILSTKLSVQSIIFDIFLFKLTVESDKNDLTDLESSA